MRILAGMLCACLVALAARAEDAPLARAAQALGADRIESLEYRAAGRYYQFTQAPAPELPWPPFEVRDYVATLDYARAAVHAKYHRTQVQEPGRARPHSEATMDQYARDGMAWNLTPAPTAIPANLAERNAELWASPQGFVKAALARGATVKREGEATRVSFTIDGHPFDGWIDARGDVTRVRSIMDSPVLGDTPLEFRFSDYRDFGGVRFPARIERVIAGMPWYELDVSAVRINVADVFDVPAQVASQPRPSMAVVDVTELAPGVLLLGGGSHNSVAVEQQTGVLVIEAPLGEERSEAVIARVRAAFPGKPIIGVVNTHVHFDHAGGLRTYAAEGIPVITLERNARYYEQAWSQPRTLSPDRLARSPRKPQFRAFAGRLVFDDVRHPVELHEILGSGHNDAFAMAYLPKQRLLVQGDAWTPTAPGAKPPAVVNPLWLNLRDNIERLALDVERIVPLHGAPQGIADFRRAIAGVAGAAP
jgi:glyoxylase-like metal-dependent hydrolase (beta-lactamase superfamily II)